MINWMERVEIGRVSTHCEKNDVVRKGMPF